MSKTRFLVRDQDVRFTPYTRGLATAMWNGKVGLTFAPGKKQLHARTGSWDRDLDADLRRLRDHYTTHQLVCLLEDHELENLRIANLVDAAPKIGIEVARFPIE